MKPQKTPAQQLLIERGVPIGAVLLVVFGIIGLVTDSTLAGVLAGAGLMMIVGSFALRRSA